MLFRTGSQKGCRRFRLHLFFVEGELRQWITSSHISLFPAFISARSHAQHHVQTHMVSCGEPSKVKQSTSVSANLNRRCRVFYETGKLSTGTEVPEFSFETKCYRSTTKPCSFCLNLNQVMLKFCLWTLRAHHQLPAFDKLEGEQF